MNNNRIQSNGHCRVSKMWLVFTPHVPENYDTQPVYMNKEIKVK